MFSVADQLGLFEGILSHNQLGNRKVRFMNTAIQTTVPDQLLDQAQALIREGWATDLDEILADALRRYVDSHSPELAESFIREDVEWGLRGKE